MPVDAKKLEDGVRKLRAEVEERHKQALVAYEPHGNALCYQDVLDLIDRLIADCGMPELEVHNAE